MSVSASDLEEIWSRNATVPQAFDELLHGLFIKTAARLPDSLAVDAWDGKFTYAELDRASSQLASRLIEAGLDIGVETMVPICLEKSVWAIVAMLAILKAGGAFVPIDPSQPAPRKESLLRQTRASIVVASSSTAGLLESAGCTVVVVEPDNFKGLECDEATIFRSFESARAAYVLFTSGTTGEAKGVVMEHRAVASSQIHRRERKGYIRNRRVFQFSSFTFDSCIDEIFMTLGAGGIVCVPSDHDRMNRLGAALQEMSVDLLEVTPTVGRLISPGEATSIGTIVFGGEFLSRLDCMPWKDKARVINTYGPTECCVECVVGDITPDTAPGLLGTPVGSVVWIVNPEDHNELAACGAVGELLVEGPALARGYLNDHEKTALSFIEDPAWLLRGPAGRPGRCGRLYKTGDLVKYDENGMIAYVGRKDTQVKIHGQRVELGEIESHVAKSIPEAKHVVVDLVSSEDSNQTLVSFVQLVDDSTVPGSSEEVLLEPITGVDFIQASLYESVPRYMVPAVFFNIRYCPMTVSGKADRKVLREAATRRLKLEGNTKRATMGATMVLQPLNSKERKLRQLYAKVLKLDPSSIGINDDFFQLGGNSIAAIKLAGQARKQGLKLAVANVLQTPRLCDLAAAAGTKPAVKSKALIAPFSLLEPDENSRRPREQVATAYCLNSSTIEDLFPCTPLQEGLFSLSNRSSGEYMIQKVLRLSENIDTHKFCLAWGIVVETLAILRTRIFLTDNHHAALQGTLKAETLRWTQADDVMKHLADDKVRPMGYGDPLTRYALVETEHGTWFIWTIHHCLYDGWTMPRILAMVERAYQNLPLAKPANFNLFISHLLDRDPEESHQFWKDYLAGAQRTTLPKRVTAPGPGQARGFLEKHQPITLSNRRHTPRTIISAALGLVLGKRIDSDDVVFGTTVSGRDVPIDDIEDIMGPTIATVPTRVLMNPNNTINELLDTVQRLAVSMGPHEHEGIHNIASLGQSYREACDFQVYLVIQHDDSGHLDSEALGQWQGESGKPNGLSTYPLMIECGVQRGGIGIQASFDSELLSEIDMEQILDQFYFTLGQLLENSGDHKLQDLQFTSMSDLQQIMTWNSTVPSPVEALLHEIFAAKSRECPKSSAVNAWDGHLTYRELDDLSSHLAARLIRTGVKAGAMVPICFEKTMFAVVAMLGVLKAGGAFVPLDPEQPIHRRDGIVKQADGPVILTSAKNATVVGSDGREVLIVGYSLFQDIHTCAVELCTDIRPEDPAYVLMTSGSTGNPKGVVMQHRAVSSSLSLRAKGQSFGPHSRTLQFASYTFDAIFDEIFMTLISGGCVCIPSDEDRMSDLHGAIIKLGVNTLGLTPTVARLIDPNEVPEVRQVILWGEAVFRNDLARWSHIDNLMITCGPTECCVTVAQYNVDVNNLPCGSLIGKAVGARSWIVNPRDVGQLVPIGAIGELVVESPSLAHGYLKDPEKTTAAFIKSPGFLRSVPDRSHGTCRFYKTGDLVRYDPEGNLIYIGRKDAQIKLNGQRVELGEIEHQIAFCVPTASHIVVSVVTLASGQQVLAAFIKTSNDGTIADANDGVHIRLQAMVNQPDIEREMSNRCPRHMIPTAMFSINDVPRTLTGKVDRKLLCEAAGAFRLKDLQPASASSIKTLRPMSDNEECLQKIWADLLQLEPSTIHLTDSFIQLGGNS